MNLASHLQAIVDAREEDYGNPRRCHDAIASAWNGYSMNIDDALTAYDVALMFAIAKIIRLAHTPKTDSFNDAHVYLHFAEDFRHDK